jgi:hypothetical protein
MNCKKLKWAQIKWQGPKLNSGAGHLFVGIVDPFVEFCPRSDTH